MKRILAIATLLPGSQLTYADNNHQVEHPPIPGTENTPSMHQMPTNPRPIVVEVMSRMEICSKAQKLIN